MVHDDTVVQAEVVQRLASVFRYFPFQVVSVVFLNQTM